MLDLPSAPETPAANAMLVQVHDVFEDILSKRLSTPPDTVLDDITITNKLLQTVDRLYRSINPLGNESLSAALNLLQQAVRALCDGQQDAVLVRMQQCCDVTKEVLASDCRIEEKLWAVRIRLVSLLHIHNFYTDSPDMVLIRAEYSNTLLELTGTEVVGDALNFFHTKKKWSLFRSTALDDTYKRIVVELGNIRYCMTKYAGVAFDILLKNREPAELPTLCRKPHEIIAAHRGSVVCLKAHDKHLFSGSLGKNISVWDPYTQTEVASMCGHTDAVNMLLFLKGRLYSASKDRTIRVWDLSSYSEIACLRGHTGSVSSIVTDGERIYSGSVDLTVRVWDERSLASSVEVGLYRSHASISRTLLVDKNILFLSGGDNAIRLWDLSTMTEMRTLPGHTDTVCAMIKHEHRLFSCSFDGTIRAWDAASFEEISRLRGHTGPINSLATSSGVLFSASSDEFIRVWDLNSYTEVGILKGHSDIVNTVETAGGLLFSGSVDQAIHIRLA